MAILRVTPTPTPAFSSYQPNYSPLNYSFNPTPAPTPTPTVQGNWLRPMPDGTTYQQTSGPGGSFPLSQPRPQIQGITTTNPATPAPATQAPQQSGPSEGDIYLNWLKSQYDAQNASIDQMGSGIESQRTSMEQMANNNWQQTANTLGQQYSTNQTDLKDYQSKSLADISSNLKNLWEQGGRLLGSRGATDSSAANMYNYALGKLGSQQRGDIMQDVSKRLTNLKSVYDTNMKNLELEKNNNLQQIAQWYGDAVNQVRGMKSQLQGQVSEQALNVAMQMLGQVQDRTAQQRSILDQWAASTAQSLPQLTKMLNANSQNLAPVTGITNNLNFSGANQGTGLFGFGNQGQSSVDWLKNLFGG